jgi:hypothetical protein
MQTITFSEWLAELDAEAARRGYAQPITQQTGADCWSLAYEDGTTPAEALTADEEC